MGYLTPPPAPAPVVVYKDVGGLVSDYEAQTEIYRRENREVRLHECRSACTMALSLPNVCVYPDAQVKFHLAYNANTRATDYDVSARLFNYYPAAVKGRLGDLTRDYRVLSGLELISLGVRNCNGPDRVMIASRRPQRAPASAASGSIGEFGDIARTVRTAVASAFTDGKDVASAPIRVAAIDRRPIATAAEQTMGAPTPRDAFSYSPSAVAARSVSEATPPTPPRRPPSLALDMQDAQPSQFMRLIPGAHPILDASHFSNDAMAYK